MQQSREIVGTAIDLAVNFFDAARMHSGGVAEEILGRAIEGKGDRLFISTKICTGLDESPARLRRTLFSAKPE